MSNFHTNKPTLFKCYSELGWIFVRATKEQNAQRYAHRLMLSKIIRSREAAEEEIPPGMYVHNYIKA